MKIKICKKLYEPIAKRTRSGLKKLLSSNKKWISATKTHNFMINDSLCDWLKLYGKTRNIKHKHKIRLFENNFKEFIMNKGIEFEKKVIKYLKNTFKCVKVADFYTVNDAKKTIKHMKNGVPIIYSAPIYNQYNKTYGIIDLLVRSDYINQIFNENTIPTHLETFKAPNLNGKYHYRVIDIKFSTLNLASDGLHLLNCGRMPAYKSQLYVYNEAISEIQGYNPHSAYICGRRWKYTKNNVKYSGDKCDDRLGIVDFSNYDYEYIEKSKEAIDWYRKVSENGLKWTVYPPTNNNLYPNMNNDSGEWDQLKKKIAKNNGEITMLWNCGIKQRQLSLDKGITSWFDKECNSDLMNIKGERGEIVDRMININRDSYEIIDYKEINGEWLEESDNDMYVDFETINDICAPIDNIPYQKNFNNIFMIGVGMRKNNKWNYKSFICRDTSKQEELRIITEFIDFYTTHNSPKVYYWCAEEKFWNSACGYHGLNSNINWFDMCKQFKTNQIVLKGCFGFGLKEIVKKMYEYEMIDTVLESECSNGMMAMVKAWKCYDTNMDPMSSHIMKDIEKYNEFDCKSIYDIVNYFRNLCTN
jgi:hypothetical protein